MKELFFSAAGITGTVYISDEKQESNLRRVYPCFFSDNRTTAPDFIIKHTKDPTFPHPEESYSASAPVAKTSEITYSILGTFPEYEVKSAGRGYISGIMTALKKALIETVIVKKRGIPLHSSFGIINKKEGSERSFIFAANSGGGKSTAASTAFDICLNEEMNLLLPGIGREWNTLPSPFGFTAPKGELKKKRNPSDIFFLRKSPDFRVEPLNKETALRELLGCSMHNGGKAAAEILIENAAEAVSCFGVKLLYFKPDKGLKNFLLETE